MKAETQTYKESKNKKFTFPRNSLTYDSASEQTDKYIHSQNDASSHLHNEDLMFERGPQLRPIQVDPEKLIHYELISKGSEHLRSMNGVNGQGGMITSNSFAVSGTPTDNLSNHYKQQAFFQINYFGCGAPNGIQLTDQNLSSKNLSSSVGQTFRKIPPKPEINLSNISAQSSHLNQESQPTTGQRHQGIIQQLFNNIFNQEFNFGQFNDHSNYCQSLALLSPRHIKAAVLNYDHKYIERDQKWSQNSVIEKLYYLFETISELQQKLVDERNKQKSILKFFNTSEMNMEDQCNSRSRQVCLTCNESNLKRNHQASQMVPSDGSLNKQHQDQVEQLSNKIMQKNVRIEFLEKKVSLLEEQSTQMKDRIKQNIEQYEQEIKLKEEINQREKANMVKDVQDANDEVQRQQNEFLQRERQMQNRIAYLEKLTQQQQEYAQQSVTHGGGSVMTQSSSLHPDKHTNARSSINSVPFISQGVVHESLQSIDSQKNQFSQPANKVSPSARQRCNSFILKGENEVSSLIEPQVAKTNKRQSKGLRLSMGDTPCFNSQKAVQGIVIKSGQIKRAANRQTHNTNPAQADTSDNNYATFGSPSSDQRQLSLPVNNKAQANKSGHFSYSNQNTSNARQTQKRLSQIQVTAPTPKPQGKVQNLRGLHIPNRSKTPTDSFANSYKQADLQKQLQLVTLGGNGEQSLNNTRDFIREMKAQSINKIMSPTNQKSESVQLFDDLNKTFNIGSFKRFSSSKNKQTPYELGPSQFNMIIGSIGSRLNKLKIKSDQPPFSKGHAINRGASSATIKSSSLISNQKKEIDRANLAFNQQCSLQSPVQSQISKNKQFQQMIQQQQLNIRHAPSSSEGDRRLSSHDVVVIKRNSISQEKRVNKRNLEVNSIPAKNIRISPYCINWKKPPKNVNTSFEPKSNKGQSQLITQPTNRVKIENKVNKGNADYQSQHLVLARKIISSRKLRNSSNTQDNPPHLSHQTNEESYRQKGSNNSEDQDGQCIVNNWTEES